jgi:hypothetical protein
VLTLTASWGKALFGDSKTSVTLFGLARSGLPYSFVYNCTGAGTTNTFGDPACGNFTANRDLFYVPTGPNDPRVNFAAPGSTKPAVLDAFINRYGLAQYRGQIAPRNAFNNPWVETLDLHVAQEIPSPFEGHKAVITFDILNLTNLLNPAWGRLTQVGFPATVPVVSAKIVNGQYVYSGSPSTVGSQINNTGSVWGLLMGIRYQF